MILAASVALAPVQIPENFLLTEKAAHAPQSEAEKAEVWWDISDKLHQPLLRNPCGRKSATTADRSDARTIVQHTTSPSYSGEQLVIYRSAKAARTAMSGLLADARRCATLPDANPHTTYSDGKTRWAVSRTRLADEAALMSMTMYDKLNKDWEPALTGIVARKGRALIIYTGDEDGIGHGQKQAVKALRASAGKMAAKVCGLHGVC
jgi:hypothetical protein